MRGVSRRNKAPNWNFTQAELGGCVVWLAKIGQSSEGENSRTEALSWDTIKTVTTKQL